MVPGGWVRLGELPVTASGKVDRRALPEAGQEGVRGEYESPRTRVEEVLAGIWEEVLGVERVGRQDSFFELGGHSLAAVRVASRVREAFEVELPVKTVFEAVRLLVLAEKV